MSAIPAAEQPILEALVHIRNRLTALKKDSGQYIRAQDVLDIYKAVIKQVTRLNAVRDEDDSAPPDQPAQAEDAPANATASASSAAQESHALTPVPAGNRVDTTLNDVFALLSLFFLTIGRNRETPAAFCQLSCMKQLLDHLSEGGVYTEADLEPFAQRLSELRTMVRADAENGKHPPALTKLMMRKLDTCSCVLKILQSTLTVLSVELVPIHQRLIAVRRQIVAAAARPKIPRAEIRALQEELRRIDSKRVDGKFLGPGGSSVPAGQAILVGLLEEGFEICHEINVRNDEVPMTLQPIYDRLVGIKKELEHLVLTHRWTLRETDLWNYQVTLKEIDRMRVNGKFVDSEGRQPEGQLVLLYLLRRCYGLIYRLVASSEPIGEELMPVSNKLSTISKCLKEVSKYGGPYTMRDLYPYRLALHQIDALRTEVKDKDGNPTGVRKWLAADGSVPEGQAILRAQFEEVLQTIEEMLNEDDDDDDDDDDEDEGEDDEDDVDSDEKGCIEPGVVSEEEQEHGRGPEPEPAEAGSSMARTYSSHASSVGDMHFLPLSTGLDRLSLAQLGEVSRPAHQGPFSPAPAQPFVTPAARPHPFADITPKATLPPLERDVSYATSGGRETCGAASTAAPSASASHAPSPTDSPVNVLWTARQPSRSASVVSTISRPGTASPCWSEQSPAIFSPVPGSGPGPGEGRASPRPCISSSPRRSKPISMHVTSLVCCKR